MSAIVYRGTDNRIAEVSLVPGIGGGVNPLVSTTPGPTDAASDPVGYVRAAGANAVVYRSPDNHFRQVSLAIAGSWQGPRDLTARTGGVNATGKPFPYTRSNGVSTVLYRSGDGNHVRALELLPSATTVAPSEDRGLP